MEGLHIQLSHCYLVTPLNQASIPLTWQMILKINANIHSAYYVTILTWWRRQMETFSVFWPFVMGIHRSPLDSPSKGQWRGALMLSWTCAWTNGWANTRDSGDLTHRRAHYDVTIMDIEMCAMEDNSVKAGLLKIDSTKPHTTLST